MLKARGVLRHCALALMLVGTALPLTAGTASAQSSEIRYVVNNEAVTSYDIQRRAAFLRLQNRRGNVQELATQEMIDQAVRNAEVKRMRIRISDDQVAAAYERFAKSNNMSPAQMDQVLSQTGVTKGHFRDFIRAQMSWSQVLASKSGASPSAGGRISEQEAVRQMLQQGGNKPTATEYMLQQVIFVVPASERRSKLGTRKREAEAMRQRFRSCDSTREFARGLLDVTVRDLGRMLDPELPPDWAKHIKATKAGGATVVRETERGVEFIGVCSAREVSDDRAATMVLQSQQGAAGGNEATDKLSENLTKELRAKAHIVRR